ncbi:MAG TPA: VWA domain-containing protein [Spirochaetia bacterium]|nr:VWA domain-containing protein [Spirochaetia bacterium]
MLSFERPALLAFLLLVPLLAFARRLFRARLSAPRFPVAALPGEAPPAPPLARRALFFLAQALLWLGLALLVLASAGPARVSRRVLYLSRGNEIVFVLDVSPSMAAEDFEPTRLAASKAIIDEFLSSRRNETVGLVAFGGEAALVCPPTLDYGVLRRRLGELEPGLLGEGTALGAGIGVALAHSGGKGAPARYVILLTDGENNAGPMAPATAAALAARRGVSVSVIGVGSRGEVPVTYVDPDTGQRRSGTYLSGFDRASLESLARIGGGSYFAAESPEALERAFSAVSEDSVSLAMTRSVSTEDSLARPLLALALAALVLARLLGLLSGGDFL